MNWLEEAIAEAKHPYYIRFHDEPWCEVRPDGTIIVMEYQWAICSRDVGLLKTFNDPRKCLRSYCILRDLYLVQRR